MKGLTTVFDTEYGTVKAVNNISLSVTKGQTLGIVGESGCGKSVTALSIMGLLEANGKVVSGEICLKGIDLLKADKRKFKKMRGTDFSMVFQDPQASLNPVISVGSQLVETLRTHRNISVKDAKKIALEQLVKVGLPNPERVMNSYSFELSGGMCQRVMISMALLLNPEVLIVDEPTTALDPTVQVQILAELKRLQLELGMAIILITHDLGVIAAIADQVAVMYTGSIVETASVKQLFEAPNHPYTKALINSIPRFGAEELAPIEGQPPSLINLPSGCSFYQRCPQAEPCCKNYQPVLREFRPGHHSACRQSAMKTLLEVSNR